ncbi:related to 6-hydroxy-d-nicotine oxidase [Rhynchosporium secalis]|uniref:Related to 6-hydroxy-d-nicotine oxidase n=1 Tax=Rhynchosporium secalis TaxID=38038 RepID=A0A1E1LXU5_RHYSE|nr:related to 6-hydroxy-d-nicotine oxidase [Rhynchosporium secalis]
MMWLETIAAILTVLSIASANPDPLAPLDKLLSNPASFGFESLCEDVKAQIKKLSGLDNCQAACSLLSILVPTAVSLAASSTYQKIPYWSVQQSEVTPVCRIDVKLAKDISTTVKVSKLTQCPFAVKSGGHAAFAGGSSIQNGILINLAKLNEITLSEDRQTTRVGPGNNWYDVYQALDPLGVSVVGGREAGVGTGGLILGGGISYFSGRFGWACDNVRNYEVILADGQIVNASSSSNPDLYWALRGGSGVNFGLVSRFDLATFEQGLLWAGTRYYDFSQRAPMVDAFSKFVIEAPTDDLAHLFVAFGYVAELGGFIGVSGPAYGKPVANAPIFTDLNQISGLADATGFNNMSALSVALNQTIFQRQTGKTVTIKADPALLKAIVQIFTEEARTVIDVPGIAPFFAFQPLSINIIDKMSKSGGNTLGLSVADGPLTILNNNWGWTNAADDTRVFDAVNRFVSRSFNLAKSMGMDNDFIYMNYASQDQDVYAGYGKANVDRLKAVQKKYDPQGVFKKLQPGYFKL